MTTHKVRFGLDNHAVDRLVSPGFGLAQEQTGMPDPLKKLRLQGFNNLTKTLSFNIYDVCYADLHSRTPSSLSDLLLKVAP